MFHLSDAFLSNFSEQHLSVFIADFCGSSEVNHSLTVTAQLPLWNQISHSLFCVNQFATYVPQESTISVALDDYTFSKLRNSIVHGPFHVIDAIFTLSTYLTMESVIYILKADISSCISVQILISRSFII